MLIKEEREKIMRKILKLIGKALLVLILLVAVTTIILAVRHNILSKKDAKKVKNAYGEFYRLSTGEDVNYTFYDSPSEDVAVILPGFGCSSTHYEFDALAKGLSDKYKIVLYEPLGVGLSDQTERERLSENYCKELHELMCHLGYQKFTIIGHSISGIYSLKYTQMYPNDVKAFIGIDASVPEQVKEAKGLEKPENMVILYGLLKTLYINTGIQRALTELSFKKTLETIPTITDEKDKENALALNCIHQLNKTQLAEINDFKINAEDGYDLKFPEQTPVLYILSNDTIKTSSLDWEDLHSKLITNKNSKIVKIDGNHYLHTSNLDGVLDTIKGWNYN